MADEQKSLNDTGLGLGDFLSRGASEVKTEDTPKVDIKPEVKTDAADVSSAPAKVKADAKPDVKADVKTDAKPGTVEQPAHQPNWDDDTNPWKKKANEFDQRFRDTQRDRSRLENEFRQQQQALTKLQAQMDGTYDPRVHEPPPPDPQAFRTWGAIEGKAQASYAAAIRQRVASGKDANQAAQEIEAGLQRYAELFGQDRAVQERILMADDPVQAAMDAVSGHEFFHQWGSDPATIVERIKQKLTEELTPQIAAREAARIQKELSSKHSEPRGIGHVQGTGGAAEAKIAKDNAGRPKPLGQLFGGH